MKKKDWELLLLAIGFIAAYCLGCLGYFEYSTKLNWHVFFDFAAETYRSDRSSAAFYALQMLVFNPPYISEPIPLTLHLGRWFAAVSFLWATGKVIYLLLNRYIQNFKLRFRKNHLILFGLDKFGLAIALAAKKDGKKPVVVADNPKEEDMNELLRNGIPVVTGRLSEASTLRRARAERADMVYALCGDDETTIEVASQFCKEGETSTSANERMGVFFLKNTDLRTALYQHNIYPSRNMSIQWHDMHSVRARIALGGISLDHISLPEESGKRPQMIIIGFGQMGQSLAVQAALISHFPSGGKLKIHIVDESARKQIHALRHNYPNILLTADLERIGGSLQDPDVNQKVVDLFREIGKSGELLACAVCHDDANVKNFIEAHALAKALEKSPIPILVYQTTATGLCPLLTPGSDAGPADHPRLIPFGMAEDIWTYESIKNDDRDKLAMAFHDVYLEGRRKAREEAKGALAFRPAEKPWKALDETYREASRALADHLPIKLHMLGLRLLKPGKIHRSAAAQMDASKMGILSKMEHARWCAERWLSGWSKGPRNDEAKRHPDLIPWNELPDKEQRIDKELMESMPRVVARAGLGLAGKDQ